MTAVWIILAALLAVVLLGTVLFLIACRRGPVPDLTKPEVIAKWGRAEQTEEILAGVRLMQDAENIFLPSYDGLRLHGRLLQQPGAKGTILLFHGYRSSWAIDFSIVLPYYFTLGYNLLAVDERAHGESEGTYITFGVRERHDVASWAAYAAMHFGPAHPLILDGLSMGAATVLLASDLELPPSVRGHHRRLRLLFAVRDHEKRAALALPVARLRAAAGAYRRFYPAVRRLRPAGGLGDGGRRPHEAAHPLHPRHRRSVCPLLHVAGGV